eukprot:Gb_33693 [translate_table: standard]
MSMAIVQPLRKRKKKMTLVFGQMLSFHNRKDGIKTTNSSPNTSLEDVRNLFQVCRLHVMDQPVVSSIYDCFLHGYLDNRVLPEAKLGHAHIIQTGFKCEEVLVGNKLVTLYVKCGSLADARRVFDQMRERDVISWTAIISAYTKHGLDEEALALFCQMKVADVEPNWFTFAIVLPACAKLACLEEGKEIHEDIIRSGFHSDLFVENALVNMYAKCGCMEKAHTVFDKMIQRDVVSWNAMIAGYTQNGRVDEALKLFQRMPQRNLVSWNAMVAGYAQNGYSEEALQLFQQMQLAGVKPNSTTFVSVLPACANLAALEQGKQIHEEIIESGFQFDHFVGNALVDMYAKCGSMENARNVFDNMHRQNVVSWTAIIAGYTQNGISQEALKLFRQMQLSGVKPNATTFASVLPACSDLGALKQGMEIHEKVIRSGIQSNIFVWNALVDMYAKCGSIDYAHNAFDKMPKRDAVSWNTMIAGLAHNGRVEEALKFFQKMPERDAVSWTAMISGYAQNGLGEEALKLFQQMNLTGMNANAKTFVSVLTACANLTSLGEGIEIHEKIIRSGFQTDVFVGNALIDMYAKCRSIENAHDSFDKMHNRNVVSWTAMITGYAQNGHVDEALKLFQKMPERNVISWTAMIAGYAQNGHSEEALKLFGQMQLEGMKPNSKTFASVLPACANLAALEQGKDIHDELVRCGFQSDVFVGNALVDMYAKCGSIENARHVFDTMPQRDVVSWTSMISGYAMHGCGKEALKLFRQMQHSGTKPDHVTLVGVLSACCHAGLVDEGWQYFDWMSQYHHITPTMEHYGCMVDLLGRAGRLDEAEDFINKMPIKPDANVWGSLLGACRLHNNIELGVCVAEHLFELDPNNGAPYVLLSNTYATAGRWDDLEKVRKTMKERRVKKKPGCSWIEVNKLVNTFLVGDRSHPQTKEIYAKLDELSRQMKAAGYVANTKVIMHDVEEEQKEQILCYHSEKLAIAFGLINTSNGTTIRIIKNLRVCDNCHSAAKFISNIVKREIVVRDANRFHHFKDGRCSCGDYW